MFRVCSCWSVKIRCLFCCLLYFTEGFSSLFKDIQVVTTRPLGFYSGHPHVQPAPSAPHALFHLQVVEVHPQQIVDPLSGCGPSMPHPYLHQTSFISIHPFETGANALDLSHKTGERVISKLARNKEQPKTRHDQKFARNL